MAHKFITNQDKLLEDVIKNILPKTKAMDILVGYFYFTGYAGIAEQLQDKQVRILVGMDIDKTIRKVLTCEKESAAKSRAEAKEDYYTSLVNLINNTDLLDDQSSQEQFKMFCSKIADGSLVIKRTQDPCHAKLYLFAHNDLLSENGDYPGVVITGSSNLSYQGIKGRTELNVRMNDADADDYNAAKAIFDGLWETAIDITSEWEDKVIKHVWFEQLFAPYLMYLRVLKEYFEIPSQGSIRTPYDLTEGNYTNLQYQTDAVQMALTALENHNGAIIADVVGLGKSVIASTIACNVGKRVIVICPPHLKAQWENYRDEFKFTGSVFSKGVLETEAFPHYEEIRRNDEQFLIIVDEAHRFRNEYTQEYSVLHKLCAGNKVLLLTATPFNNRPADIYALIKLFQIPSQSTLQTVEDLGEIFRSLILRYKQLDKKKKANQVTEQEVKDEVQEIAKQIRTIIAPVVIRRSRLDLQQIDAYKQNLYDQGYELITPEAPVEMEYDLSALEELYLHTLELISPNDEKAAEEQSKPFFRATRYQPANYIIPDKKQELIEQLRKNKMLKEVEEDDNYSDREFNLFIGRQTNISKFMRHLLVSRFESSVFAFQKSLDYMIQSYENVINWANKVKKIPVFKKGKLPAVDEFYDVSDDNEFTQLTDTFEKYTERGFFEIDLEFLNGNFMKDLQSDLTLLRKLQDMWFAQPKADPKLQSFIPILQEKLKKEPNRKIIVFSEFADTIDYLYDSLTAAGLPVMAYTSAKSDALRHTIRTEFDAGLKQEMQTDQYKILLATDAISEGFSLHRAGAIVNYDIPYNPTRVIQRIGRINRVNKKVFENLFIYNYFPSAIGEDETHRRTISTLKMAMIHAVMGEDTKVLTCEEELNAFFKERYNQELANTEELSWDTPFRKALSNAQGTDDYDKALLIPHRARVAREVEKAHQGLIVFAKRGNDFVFKIGANATDEPILLAPEDALLILQADKTEEAQYPSKDYNAMFARIKRSLFAQDKAATGDKHVGEALKKITILEQKQLVSKDYADILIQCLRADALIGYEIRYINNLTSKDAHKLMKEIPEDYLRRQLITSESAHMGEELLILSEEIKAL